MPVPGLFAYNVRKRTVRNCKQNLKRKNTLSNYLLIHFCNKTFDVLCAQKQNAFYCNLFHNIRGAGRLTIRNFGDAIAAPRRNVNFYRETLSVSRTPISNF